jgi:hypothetical protein
MIDVNVLRARHDEKHGHQRKTNLGLEALIT